MTTSYKLESTDNFLKSKVTTVSMATLYFERKAYLWEQYYSACSERYDCMTKL